MNINDIVIRFEKKEDYRTVENLVRESFWNVYRPECSEHYVLHLLRDDPAFVKELDFCLECVQCGETYFTDEVMSDLCLKCILGGQLDVYNIPLDRRAYASNGYQKNLDRTNSVIIWDNMLHYRTSNKMEIYAKRLSNLDTIIDINCNAQKTPILLKGTQQQRLSLINAYEKYDGNQPVMFGTENFLEGNENAFTVFKTDCPYVADKLYELKVNLWNEALTYLGVASSVIQKKERMIKDEVNQLQGGVMANRYSRLNARQQACEEINRMFGTNMSVEFRDIFEQNKNSDTGSEGGMNE